MMQQEDEYVTCPYNISHSILKSRFSKHLVKCKRNYPGMEICYYNWQHHVKSSEMLKHLETCPDKAKVEAKKFEKVHNSAPVELVVHTEPPADDEEEDEDWGAEADKNPYSYKPHEAILDKKVFRSIQNATPAQRREFREQERDRHREIEEREKEVFYPEIPGAFYEEPPQPPKNRSVWQNLKKDLAATDEAEDTEAPVNRFKNLKLKNFYS